MRDLDHILVMFAAWSWSLASTPRSSSSTAGAVSSCRPRSSAPQLPSRRSPSVERGAKSSAERALDPDPGGVPNNRLGELPQLHAAELAGEPAPPPCTLPAADGRAFTALRLRRRPQLPARERALARRRAAQPGPGRPRAMKTSCTFVTTAALCRRGATTKSILAGRALCCIHELEVGRAQTRQGARLSGTAGDEPRSREASARHLTSDSDSLATARAAATSPVGGEGAAGQKDSRSSARLSIVAVVLAPGLAA